MNMLHVCKREIDVGVIADIMHRTRAAYHYAIKFVKKNEADLVKQRFVEGSNGKPFKRFLGRS